MSGKRIDWSRMKSIQPDTQSEPAGTPGEDDGYSDPLTDAAKTANDFAEAPQASFVVKDAESFLGTSQADLLKGIRS